VDSAIDLAGAIFEMNIAPAEEDRIIEAYIGSTGDEEVRARLLLFKLHVGHTAMADASYYCDGTSMPAGEHRRIFAIWPAELSDLPIQPT